MLSSLILTRPLPNVLNTIIEEYYWSLMLYLEPVDVWREALHALNRKALSNITHGCLHLRGVDLPIQESTFRDYLKKEVTILQCDTIILWLLNQYYLLCNQPEHCQQ